MSILFIILLLVLSCLLYLGLNAMVGNKYDRRRNLALKAALVRIIRRNKLVISESDVNKNKVIALDRKNNKIILIEHRNNVTWEKCFSMGELESCNVNMKTNHLKGYIQKVVVELHFSNNRDFVYFTFYDDSSDHVRELPSRIKKANYWKRKIEHHLNKVKAGHRLEYVL